MIAFRLSVTLLTLVLASPLCAHEFKKGDIVIIHPWTRATPGGATVGVGYLAITNNGKEPDRFLGGTLDGVDKVEIHEMKMNGDMMIMRELPQGIEIKPGETIAFTPGSYHLMLHGLKKPIVVGPNVKGTVSFEKAGSVDVDYKVEAFGAMTSSDHDHEMAK